MHTVYVCTEGEYSDYRVVRVVATEDEAKGFKQAGGCDNYDEWTVGLQDQRFWHHKTLYCCTLDEEGGVVSESQCELLLPDGYRGTGDSEFLSSQPGRRYHGHSAVSAGHARKLAAEARQRQHMVGIYQFGPSGVETRAGTEWEGERPEWAGYRSLSVPPDSSHQEENPVG